MNFYRIKLHTANGKAAVFATTEMACCTAEGEGRKRLAQHKRDLKKRGRGGYGRLEKLTVDTEFLTKSDWMKLVLGDTPGGFAKDDEVMFVGDLISESEVIAEFEMDGENHE